MIQEIPNLFKIQDELKAISKIIPFYYHHQLTIPIENGYKFDKRYLPNKKLVDSAKTKTIIKYNIEHKQVINYSTQLFENALSALNRYSNI